MVLLTNRRCRVWDTSHMRGHNIKQKMMLSLYAQIPTNNGFIVDRVSGETSRHRSGRAARRQNNCNKTRAACDMPLLFSWLFLFVLVAFLHLKWRYPMMSELQLIAQTQVDLVITEDAFHLWQWSQRTDSWQVKMLLHSRYTRTSRSHFLYIPISSFVCLCISACNCENMQH